MHPSPKTGWSRDVFLCALLVAAAVWTVLVSRWMLNDVVVPWDSKNHFYAMLRFLSDTIHDGELPLWNPYHFAGFPTVADPQSLLFIPSMLIFAILVPEPGMKAFDFVIFLHLLMAMFGVIGYFRFKAWHPVAAVTAALVFSFGGSAALRLQHTGMIISYAFFPLALWSLEAALDKVDWRAGLAFGITAAFMALGRDQVAFLMCLTLVALAVTKIMTAPSRWRYLRQRLPILALMGLSGGAILAVPALLTLQLLSQSNRPEISFGYAIKGSLYPANLVTVLAPDFFGALSDMFHYRGPNWETTDGKSLTDASINQIFFGTLPALFLLWHGFAGGRAVERQIRFFFVLLILALLYAFGRYTPVFEWLFDIIPGVKLYRRPADATFLINVALAYLVGYLVHRFIEAGPPRITRTGAILLSLGVVGLFAAALVFLEEHSRISSSGLEAGIALGLFALGGFVLTFAPEKHARAGMAAAFFIISVGEIGWRSAACSLNAEAKSYYAFLEVPRASDARFLDILGEDIERRHSMGQRPRVEMVGLPGPWMNSPMIYGLESTVGYNPLRLDDYQRAVGPGENAADLNLRSFPPTFRGYRSRLARLLGIEYVAFDRPVEVLPKHFPKLSAEPIYSADHLYVYRLPPAAPRAYLATCVQNVDSSDLLLKREIPDFNVPAKVLVDEQTATRRSYSECSAPDHRQVAINNYITNEVSLTVDSDVPSVLVLHDIYYPGWVVEVDGIPQPLLRANLLFRGVEVDSGHHTVVFSFHPFSFDNLKSAFLHLVGLDTKEPSRDDDNVPETADPG